MEVLYNQKAVSDSTLSSFGIDNCILRHIYYKQDSSTITNLVHHHTSFEIHIVVDGSTAYEVEGSVYRVTSGHFLLLPPYLKHRFIESEAHTVKYSLCQYVYHSRTVYHENGCAGMLAAGTHQEDVQIG